MDFPMRCVFVKIQFIYVIPPEPSHSRHFDVYDETVVLRVQGGPFGAKICSSSQSELGTSSSRS
jgi:hypothetical protein